MVKQKMYLFKEHGYQIKFGQLANDHNSGAGNANTSKENRLVFFDNQPR